MFQVWTWEESSECGRQIDIYRWAIDYLLSRSLPIPAELTDTAASLLMEWESELKAMDPEVVARHELGSTAQRATPRGGLFISQDALPREAALDPLDTAVIAGEIPWDGLSHDRAMLVLLRMAAIFRAHQARGAPGGLVDRLVDLARRLDGDTKA